jgi:sn-glycerol 3-phosphate transport system ATP-binding protein
MPDIRIEALRKTYPGNPAEVLKGIDLTIRDGEMAVLVGPSGCGKSTLLRMVAGLESITAGEIYIGERLVNRLEPAERDIAMVFQNYALYPHMTVRQNLEYGLKNRRTPRAEIDARVAEAARMLEIAPFLDRKPSALSGGQRQRVAMGRAVVRKPQAFLFDEPLSNLDAKLRGQMRVEIRRLQRRFGTTAIYVTHDQLEAMTLADRLVVMNAGQIEQVGTPMEVYERPQTLFVAAFIGAPGMNLIPADDLASHGTDLSAQPQGMAVLGCRPEDISIHPGAGHPEAGDLVIEATVDTVELAGSETLLHLHADGIMAPLVVRRQGALEAEAGSALRIGLPQAKLHRFDRQGQRLADARAGALASS